MFPMLASIAAPIISQVVGDVAQKLLPGPAGDLAATALSLLQPQQAAGGAGSMGGIGADLLAQLAGKIRISF